MATYLEATVKGDTGLLIIQGPLDLFAELLDALSIPVPPPPDALDAPQAVPDDDGPTPLRRSR